jgi:hypothetical protein
MKELNAPYSKGIQAYSPVIVGIGLGGMVLSCTFDFIRNSEFNLGTNQMAGFVVSAIIMLSGLRRLPFMGVHQWHGLLLAIYLAGTFFMGLKTRDQRHSPSLWPLQDMGVFLGDVAINFLGFVPLGYLMISYLLARKGARKTSFQLFLAVTLCLSISFLIEIAQYFLPGRTSSLIDLLFNISGAFVGISCGILEYKLFSVSLADHGGGKGQPKGSRKRKLDATL